MLGLNEALYQQHPFLSHLKFRATIPFPFSRETHGEQVRYVLKYRQLEYFQQTVLHVSQQYPFPSHLRIQSKNTFSFLTRKSWWTGSIYFRISSTGVFSTSGTSCVLWIGLINKRDFRCPSVNGVIFWHNFFKHLRLKVNNVLVLMVSSLSQLLQASSTQNKHCVALRWHESYEVKLQKTPV